MGVLTLQILVDAKDHPGRLLATKFGRFRDFGERCWGYIREMPDCSEDGASGTLIAAAPTAAALARTFRRPADSLAGCTRTNPSFRRPVHR